MSVEEYFSIIIWVLTGLTFIVLSLIFLHMIYGEKEETSAGATKATRAANLIFKLINRMPFVF